MSEEREEEWVDPVIAAYKRHVDVSIIRHNLRNSPEERLLGLMELQRFAEELQAAKTVNKRVVSDGD